MSEALVNDPFMDDSVESMPGGWSIPYRQLRAYRKNKDFFVFDSNDEKVNIICNRETIDGYNYYYQVWENYHYFGLRGILGVNGEPQGWVLDFIKYFERIFQDIEVYRAKRK